MIDGTVLACIQTPMDLSAALRARAERLGVTRETIDHVSGMAAGYAGKALAKSSAANSGAASRAPPRVRGGTHAEGEGRSWQAGLLLSRPDIRPPRKRSKNDPTWTLWPRSGPQKKCPQTQLILVKDKPDQSVSYSAWHKITKDMLPRRHPYAELTDRQRCSPAPNEVIE